jgi:hypothetical protein
MLNDPARLADIREMVLHMGLQILENQNSIMSRLSAGWSDDGAAILCKRIGETTTLLGIIRKLGGVAKA